jgi:uncharacterized protein
LKEKILKYSFIKNLSSLLFIQEIWLYGSRARGDYLERSDIDIAIVCGDISTNDWSEVLKIIDSADTLLKIDIVQYNIINDLEFKKRIKKEKIILFSRDHVSKN